MILSKRILMISQARFFCRYLGRFWLFFKSETYVLNLENSETSPVVIFDSWTMYPPGQTNGTFTAYRQWRGDEYSKQKNKLWNAPRWDELFFCRNTPCDQATRRYGCLGTAKILRIFRLRAPCILTQWTASTCMEHSASIGLIFLWISYRNRLSFGVPITAVSR